MLSNEAVKQYLTTKFIGQSLIVKDSTGSTNDDIISMAKADKDAREGCLIVSKTQKSGKGRRGRVWDSPIGSVYMSVLLKPDIPKGIAPQLTLLAAMAVADAVIALTESGLVKKEVKNRVSIKWPNDVLLDKKKICGILTEMSVGSAIDYVAVGIGINVNNTIIPDALAQKATSLRLIYGREFSLSKITAYVLNSFEPYYLDFIKNKNLSGIINKYNGLLINAGLQVRVLDPKGEYDGVARGINESGELIVDTAYKRVLIGSGEVSVRGVYGYV